MYCNVYDKPHPNEIKEIYAIDRKGLLARMEPYGFFL